MTIRRPFDMTLLSIISILAAAGAFAYAGLSAPRTETSCFTAGAGMILIMIFMVVSVAGTAARPCARFGSRVTLGLPAKLIVLSTALLVHIAIRMSLTMSDSWRKWNHQP